MSVQKANLVYATFCRARTDAGLRDDASLAELIEHHRVQAATIVTALIQRRRGLPPDALDVYGP